MNVNCNCCLCLFQVSSNNSVDDCLDNDYKQEESETDNEIDFLKPKDIKSEPEGSIIDNGENANSIDTLTVEQFSLDGDNSRKSKKRKKSNGIGKKEKRKKRHNSKVNEELVDNGAEIRDNFSYPLPYSCTKCERKFRKLESLNVHLKKHEEQSSRVYQCDQCKRYLCIYLRKIFKKIFTPEIYFIFIKKINSILNFSPG